MPHLVAFRCAHRGTQLSTGWVEGDDLRCFYHGWKYNGDGQCIEQPAEPEPFCNRIKIRSYPIQEYLGLVFAYLGEGEPPPLPRYEEFETEGVLEARADARACNWFQNFENLCDSVHVSFAHRASRTGLSNMPVPMVAAAEDDWGMLMRYQVPGGALRMSHMGMPNIKNGQVPPQPDLGTGPCEKIIWVVPTDDHNHVQFSVELAHVTGDLAQRYWSERSTWRKRLTTRTLPVARSVLAGERTVDDVQENTDNIQVVRFQDDVAQIGQGVIVDRAADHLGRSDAAVALLRRLWARELRALAEEHPLKDWRREEDFTRASWSR
jgi:5,5'-dehydrodivanillate O-demethylase